MAACLTLVCAVQHAKLSCDFTCHCPPSTLWDAHFVVCPLSPVSFCSDIPGTDTAQHMHMEQLDAITTPTKSRA